MNTARLGTWLLVCLFVTALLPEHATGTVADPQLGARSPQPAAHNPQPTTVPEGEFGGRELLERYRQIPACKMKITVDWIGEQVKATLLYRRPGCFRVDWDGFGQTMQFVVSPAEHKAYYPQDQSFMDLRRQSNDERLWDSFANPVRSFAALLEPRAADTSVLEKVWLPRLKAKGRVLEDGAPWLKFEGRGANGMRMEAWVSPEDRLIHKVTLQDPRAPDEGICTIRVDVEIPIKKLPDTAFKLQIPRAARDMEEGRNNDRAVMMGRDGPPLRHLRAKRGAKPKDAAAARALAMALLETGQTGEALRLALELEKGDPTAATSSLITHVYIAMGAQQAGLNNFISGLKKFGTALEMGEDLYVLSAAAQASPLAVDQAAALEGAIGGKKARSEHLVLLANLFRRAKQPAKAVQHALAALSVEPDVKKPVMFGRGMGMGMGMGGGPDGVSQAISLLAELGESLKVEERAQAVASLRKVETRMPDEARPMLISAYLALDDPASAERLAGELVGLGEPNWYLLGRVAEVQSRKGSKAVADRLFRQALLEVLETEPVENGSVMHILQHEGARTFLAPVLRQLAADEKAESPLQAAHWLFFAGDLQAAGQAYRDYLASPAGSPDTATTLDRLVATCLAARCAHELKDNAVADALVLGSIGDLAMLRADTPRGFPSQPFAPVLLECASGPAVREQFFRKVSEIAPEAMVEWLVGGMYMYGMGGRRGGFVGGREVGRPDDDRQAEMKALLKRLVENPDVDWANAEMLAQSMMGMQMPREAAAVYLRYVRKRPDRLNPEFLTGLAGMVESAAQEGSEGRGSGGQGPGAGVQVAAEPAPPNPNPNPTAPSPVSQSAAKASNDSEKARATAIGKELIAELEKAVKKRPGWDDGEQALAHWYSGHEQTSKAVQLLARIAKRKPSPEALAELGDAEIASGKAIQGLTHLEAALRLRPDDDEIRARLLAALEQAGRKSEALAWWRKLKASAASAGDIQAVANGLRSLGKDAEAREFILQRWTAAGVAERYPGEANGLRSEVADQLIQGKQSAKALDLFPEIGLFELDVDPEALRMVNFELPSTLWKGLIAQYDRSGRRKAAFLAYCRALAAGGVESDEAAYRRLVERARQLGRLDLAQEELKGLGAGGYGNALARSALAGVEAELGHLDTAITLNRQVLHPDGAPFPHSSPGVASAAASLAGLLEKQGKTEESARYRKWSEAFSLLEKAGADSGDPKKILETLRRVQTLFPELPCIQADIARYEPTPKDSKDDVVALRALELMLPVCGTAQACGHCGTLLSNRSAAGSAGLPWDRLMALSNQSGAALYLRATAEANWKPLSPPETLALWRKVVERDPKLLAAWEALRSAAEQQDDLKTTIDASEQVARLRGDSADDWVRYGSVLMRAGRRADARNAYARAAEIDPRTDVNLQSFENGYSDWEQSEPELAALFSSSSYYGGLFSGMEPW